MRQWSEVRNPMVGIIVAAVLAAWTIPGSRAATFTVDCDEGDAIQQRLDKNAKPGDTIQVSGSCNENIVIETDRVDLEALPGTSLLGPDNQRPTILIRARDVLVQGFASISGGGDMVVIRELSSAMLVDNIFEFAGRNAVNATDTSNVTIEGGQVRDNARTGISITRESSATIRDVVVTRNGRDGITVSASAADISGSTVTNNDRRGLNAGHARVALSPGGGGSNAFSGSGQNEIRCHSFSVLRLLEDQFVDGSVFLHPDHCVTQGDGDLIFL